MVKNSAMQTTEQLQ